MPRLLSGLQKADQIIAAMLNAMTTAQKSKVHAQLDAAANDAMSLASWRFKRQPDHLSEA
jgi:hypothetical protein